MIRRLVLAAVVGVLSTACSSGQQNPKILPDGDAPVQVVTVDAGAAPDAPCGRDDDPLNCGHCGHDCTTLARLRDPAGVRCQAGACVIPPTACAAGFAHCSANPDDGCETAINKDRSCGACGQLCASGTLCLASPGGFACGCVAPTPDLCGGRCVDLKKDAVNCGACGTTCHFPNADGHCADGVCVIGTCAAGFGDCTTDPGCETPLTASFANCGACGKSCAVLGGSAVCENSVCGRVTCEAGFGDCDQGRPDCETPLNTSLHCGSCGAECAGSTPLCAVVDGRQVCTAGCTVASPDRCGSRCVDRAVDRFNCGACDRTCDFRHAAATCRAGQCVMGTCLDGFADCNRDTRDGCEAPLDTATNCGICGVQCAGATPLCATVNGRLTCTVGCATAIPDRCGSQCVDRKTDRYHCGACDHICTFPHAGSSCAAGQCAMGACLDGFADCNKDTRDGCETALDTAANCGTCGNSCQIPNATSTCVAGTCSKPTCNPGWDSCDTTSPDCETSLGLADHCGSCTSRCSGATPLCSAASGTAMCVAGCPTAAPVRCDDTCVDVTSNAHACGSCGTSCEGRFPNAGATCAGGKCVMGACEPGYLKDGDHCLKCAAQVVGVCGRGPDGIQCGVSNGKDAFTAIKSWTTGYDDATAWNISPSYWGTVQFLDVNGDSAADVCGRAHDGIYCALAASTSFSTALPWLPEFLNDKGYYDYRDFWGSIQYPDVNGDGRRDVCARNGTGILCALGGPNSFGRADLWVSGFDDAARWWQSPYWPSVQFPDVDGDGRADVCGRGMDGIVCGLSRANGFSDLKIWEPSFADAGGWDLDASRFATIQYPDVDGDGKADVCGRHADGIRCATSTGGGFRPSSRWTAGFADPTFASPDYAATIQFPDLNDDGKADVCGKGKDGIFCALSTGSAFGPVTLWQAQFSDAAGWEAQAQSGTIQFPDLDADGKPDVCGRGKDGIVCALSNGATGFAPATLWTSNYADPTWAKPEYGSTLAFPLIDGGTCRKHSKATPFPRQAARIPF